MAQYIQQQIKAGIDSAMKAKHSTKSSQKNGKVKSEEPTIGKNSNRQKKPKAMSETVVPPLVVFEMIQSSLNFLGDGGYAAHDERQRYLRD
jgi:hypothetical protein